MVVFFSLKHGKYESEPRFKFLLHPYKGGYWWIPPPNLLADILSIFYAAGLTFNLIPFPHISSQLLKYFYLISSRVRRVGVPRPAPSGGMITLITWSALMATIGNYHVHYKESYGLR